MPSEELIVAENVSKDYELHGRPSRRLLHALFPRWVSPGQVVRALHPLSLKVRRGETLGIVGRNGSGKSTLLQILAGTLAPTTGEVTRRGRVAALLELGAGFNPEFTGVENVRLNAALHGLDAKTVAGRLDQILEFADIGQFAFEPVKTYSSGMFVRLAFATALSVDPDVLIVDEALSVGDFAFQAKCFRRVQQFLDHGGSLVFVSHDLGAVKRLCQRAIYLRRGECRADGKAGEVCDTYVAEVNAEEGLAAAERHATRVRSASADEAAAAPGLDAEAVAAFAATVDRYRRHRSEEAEIVLARLHGTDSVDGHATLGFGDMFSVELHIAVHRPVESLCVACYVRDRMQTDVMGTNTQYEDIELRDLAAGSRVRVVFHFTNWLRAGNYAVHALIADAAPLTTRYFDWIDFMLPFQSMDRIGKPAWSLFNPGIRVELDAAPSA